MGGFLNRPADVHEESATKKDRRRKRQEKSEELTFDGEGYLIHENGNVNYTYDLWKKELEQQHPMFAMSDPPGAPRTYPPNNHIIHPWSAQQNFYPLDSLRMTPSYNFSYPINQYNPAPMSVPEVRSSKKVQFADSPQAKPALSKSNDQSLSSSTRPKKLLAKTTSVPTSIEKPIYVGIDHRATIAERTQPNTSKRPRQAPEKNSSQPTAAHRTRCHRHQLPTDSPQSNGSQTVINEVSSRRLSPIVPPKTRPEQVPALANEIKAIKPRTHRRPHQTSSPIPREQKAAKPRANHSHQSLSNTSPTARRRIEMKHAGSPVMRISLSQLNQPVPTRVRM